MRRSRLLRVAWLGLAWSAGETAALTVALCLWIVSGFGGRLDTEPYQARHYAVMKWFLDLIYRTARSACGLSVTVTGPPEAGPGGDRPLIVLSRHAGPGDSLLLIHHLLSVCDRRPRVVMKATLQLDPSVDILANRVPNAFLRRVRQSRRSKIKNKLRIPNGCGWLSSRRADPPARGRPGRAQRTGPLPRGRQLDPVPLAQGHRPPPPAGPPRPGGPRGGDAQRPPAARQRRARRDRRLPGKRT